MAIEQFGFRIEGVNENPKTDKHIMAKMVNLIIVKLNEAIRKVNTNERKIRRLEHRIEILESKVDPVCRFEK